MDYYFKTHCTNFPLGERFDSFYSRLAKNRQTKNSSLPESGEQSKNSDLNNKSVLTKKTN